MKRTESLTLPAGLSGVMDYSHIKVGTYPVKNLKPGFEINVVVTEGNADSITFHLECSDNCPNIGTLGMLQMLEYSGIFEKTVYHLSKK